MNLLKLTKELNLECLCGDGASEAEVTGGYASDLMSDVIAKAKKGFVWVTNQKHMNVVAVASLVGLSAVIITGGMKPDENTVQKAKEENVVLYTSDLPAFEVVGRLYSLGVRSDAG